MWYWWMSLFEIMREKKNPQKSFIWKISSLFFEGKKKFDTCTADVG